MQTCKIETEFKAAKDYPPAPWKLNGQLYGSIWSLAPRKLQVELPPAFKLLATLGLASAFAGFVDYQPGSTLVYHELLAGVVVRLRGSLRCAFHVTNMWVDDPRSRQGGRELWGVPKELAHFRYDSRDANRAFKATAQDSNGQVLAQAAFRSVAAMPGWLRLPVPFPDLQMLHGRPYHSSGTFWSTLHLCQGGMLVPADSPLARLGIAGRKPLISFAGRDFRMRLTAARPL